MQYRTDFHRTQLNRARADYYANRLNGLSSSAMWLELRKLALLKDSSPKPLAVDSTVLNMTFAAISQSTTVYHFTEPAIKLGLQSELQFKEANADEVHKILTSVSTDAVGSDGISRKMLLAILPTVLDHITCIFNTSLHSNSFPDVWKRNIIVPINKISTPSTPNDYRPIALLSILGKVLERVVFNQISQYLDDYNLLDLLQCGFRPGHSTQIALLKLLNDVRYHMGKRMVTILVLFDFSKAFDTIVSTLLIRKLITIGFSSSATCWILSYVSGREQAVKHAGGELTDWARTINFNLIQSNLPLSLSLSLSVITRVLICSVFVVLFLRNLPSSFFVAGYC